jgi:predicted aldo/keto reductase-like oxidoreductase
VNYIDTAYVYHNEHSETAVAKALENGYRDRVFIADKLSLRKAKSMKGGAEEQFENQLVRLNTGTIDMYLVHNVTKEIWEECKEKKVLQMLEKKRTEGKLSWLGFSFHDDVETFKEVIDSYPWDFCQIQFNYMDYLDTKHQAGLEGLRYAYEKGISAVVMEPLKGSKLTFNVPGSVQKIFDSADARYTPAAWGLRFVADFPEVLTILSGMNHMDQVDENIRILSEAEPNRLTESEKTLIEAAAKEYRRLTKAGCTECGYCCPCPAGVDIPKVIGFYNQFHLFGKVPRLPGEYAFAIPKERRASSCVDCGACISKCPQHLPIPSIMKEIKPILEPEQSSPGGR